MPGSKSESAVGEAIKTARDLAGITLRELAERMGRKPSDSGLISRWESGERTPKAEDVQEIATALGLGEQDAVELIALAVSAERPQWHAVTVPERRQQFAALLAAERTATAITHVALVIPGVLQTYDVIRTIMFRGGVPEDQIDERVNARLGRRHLLTRENPPQLDVLLSEVAIRRRFGDSKVMAGQLRYLLEQMEMPHIDVRIVPLGADWSPADIGPFILFDSTEVPSTVSVDLHRSGLMLRAPEDIAVYRRAADDTREEAMSPAESAELIAQVATELEQE